MGEEGERVVGMGKCEENGDDRGRDFYKTAESVVSCAGVAPDDWVH